MKPDADLLGIVELPGQYRATDIAFSVDGSEVLVGTNNHSGRKEFLGILWVGMNGVLGSRELQLDLVNPDLDSLVSCHPLDQKRLLARAARNSSHRPDFEQLWLCERDVGIAPVLLHQAMSRLKCGVSADRMHVGIMVGNNDDQAIVIKSLVTTSEADPVPVQTSEDVRCIAVDSKRGVAWADKETVCRLTINGLEKTRWNIPGVHHLEFSTDGTLWARHQRKITRLNTDGTAQEMNPEWLAVDVTQTKAIFANSKGLGVVSLHNGRKGRTITIKSETLMSHCWHLPTMRFAVHDFFGDTSRLRVYQLPAVQE